MRVQLIEDQGIYLSPVQDLPEACLVKLRCPELHAAQKGVGTQGQ